MDTVCSLPHKTRSTTGTVFYFIFTDFHLELLAHNLEICEISSMTQTNTLNLSDLVLPPEEISKILLKTVQNPATLSLFVEIIKILIISHLSIIPFLELKEKVKFCQLPHQFYRVSTQ